MTPRELMLHLEGVNKRREREIEWIAWQAAQIINHRTPAMGEKHRRAITVDDLLGRKKSGVVNVADFGNPETFRRYMQERLQGAGGAA